MNSPQNIAVDPLIAQRSRTVLLVDDEQAGLQLRKLVLVSRGFEVLATDTSESALSLFRTHDVDAVVTDHLLGPSTAAKLASEMKRLKPHIPIVSLSGTTDPEEALKYADHFIGKAEGPETLIATLDSILARQSTQLSRAAEVQRSTRADLPVGALLAAIVEDSSDAILSKTLDGVITSWNHAAEAMFGYKAEEIVGRSVETLLPPDRPDEVKHILRRLKRGERICHFETVRLAKDGSRHEVALTISPIRDVHGRLVGASTIARDITAQKQAELALRQAEKLALAGRMATTVAHEINNPLEAVGNILYLLRNVVELNGQSRAYLDAAQEELKRVSEIVNVTLGMQRGTANRREPVRVTEILENVLTLYQRKSTAIGIEVVRNYCYDGTIIGSRGELRQVFSNLIINAIDALALAGDKLVIRVRRTRRLATGEQGVRISIFDNGPGIAREHRSQLFEAFYTSKGEQGTGIGLWVSRTIVQQHGGTLRMYSSTKDGRSGTCFSVFLPMENAA